jgi:hypothetical protein
MKVFLGWSGARSKALANVIGAFIEALVPDCHVFFSPSDIDKGRQWRGAVAQQLQESDAGVWCLTSRSLKSFWIPFEAGAISKASTPSRVCPLLFGMAPSKLPSPLADFHTATFEKAEVWSLIKSLWPADGPNAADLERRRGVFDRLWSGLQKEVDAILAAASDDDSPIERIQGHWWSKIQVGPAVGAIGYVTIGADPVTEAPYLIGSSYEADGSDAAEWKSKGACVIERQGEIVFFYYWEGSHTSENPLFVGSGEIRFPTGASSIERGTNFFTDTMLAEIPASVIKKGAFRRATAVEEEVMRSGGASRIGLIQTKLAEPW